ncbi:tyrosine-type recombinase/integrase [Saccharothrix lopnurensis]|uniref:Tyrosine-type recombinase/integrase n=1 Tax=Saccharothrix lopnurensis TaxID=1670621 RepID=A0ABW1P352_9PSEU
MKGSIYRRCGCRDPLTKRQLGAQCPKLKRRGHGTWALRQELPPHPKTGQRRNFPRGGYESSGEAQADLDRVRALLDIPGDDDPDGMERIVGMLVELARTRDPLPSYEETAARLRRGHSLQAAGTLGDALDTWLAGRKTLRPTTRRSYEGHLRVHIIPAIGHVRRDRLTVAQLDHMFSEIDERNREVEEGNALRRDARARLAVATSRAERRAIRAELEVLPAFRRVTGPATQQRIRATLRKALNDLIRTDPVMTFNPAKWVELAPGERPTPVVWTDEHVTHWQATGERPSPVMVWTPEQAGAYLDYLEGDRLYAMWHLLVYRGLRRGEACGARHVDFNSHSSLLTISEQLVMLGTAVVVGKPKSAASRRRIALDAETVRVLRAHQRQQRKERMQWGAAWADSGRLFVREDGAPLVPEWVTDQHERQVAEAGLPPVRLHDLRHTAASVMLAAEVDVKVVQETLGHSSIVLTLDTYTSVFPQVATDAAEATAAAVPRKRAASRVRRV